MRRSFKPRAINVKLLKATLAEILLREQQPHVLPKKLQGNGNPTMWNQGSFRCRTGMCFAGWAAMVDGWKWVVPAGRPFLRLYEGNRDDEDRILRVRKAGKKQLRVDDAAGKALGLNRVEERWFFASGNDIRMLMRMVVACLKYPRKEHFFDRMIALYAARVDRPETEVLGNAATMRSLQMLKDDLFRSP